MSASILVMNSTYTTAAARCTVRVVACTSPNRVNVTLDDVHAEKLRRMADRTHVDEGALARSLPMTALDDADPDAHAAPANVTALLDAIPGAFERARGGPGAVKEGRGLPLADLG